MVGATYPLDKENTQPQVVPFLNPGGETDDCDDWLTGEEYLKFHNAFMSLMGVDLDENEEMLLEWEWAHFFCTVHEKCLTPNLDCDEWMHLYNYLLKHKAEFLAVAEYLDHTEFYDSLLVDVIAHMEICYNKVSYGTVTATNLPLAGILESLNPKNGNPQFPASYYAGIVYNSNHFVYAKATKAELIDGIDLTFYVGNKFEEVGTGFAKLVDGNIVISIYNRVPGGEIGAIAFNKPMTDKMPKNGNIHSQKEADLKNDLGATTGFNHDGKLVIPAPCGNDIYIYFHAGTMQFYK
jgi:hypothetical protein